MHGCDYNLDERLQSLKPHPPANLIIFYRSSERHSELSPQGRNVNDVYNEGES